MPISVIQLTKF